MQIRHAVGIAALALVVYAGARVLLAPRPRSVSGPRAVFAATRRDLGRVPAGESVALGFPLRNDGSQDLEIRSVEGDCGCVTSEFPRLVAPGGSAEIRGRFEPEAHWDGLVEKQLLVRTNDPTQPELKLAVAATVVPFIAMEPGGPLIVPYEPGRSYQREVRLVPRKGSPVGISSPQCDSPLVRAALLPPEPGDTARAYRLRLTIGPGPAPGDFNATVRMDTTEARLPQCWLAVVGLAQRGPVVSPRELSVPSLQPTGSGQELGRIQLFTRTGQLQLKRIETGSRLLRASVEPSTPGQFYDVTLTAAERLQPGLLSTTLRFHTDSPVAPVVSVPVRVTVQ
ncbi:MAG: DUF1573 domain-containing protein [Armatimonadota bacterium]